VTFLTPAVLCLLLVLGPLQELRQLLNQQAAESSAAISAERFEAARKAEGSAAAAVDAAQTAAASALHAAEVRVALLEGQLEVVEQERDLLQQQVRCCVVLLLQHCSSFDVLAPSLFVHALHAAEVRVALLEGQVEVVEQERDLLQQQVRCCCVMLLQHCSCYRCRRASLVMCANPAVCVHVCYQETS
jgi:hypothetical protein